MLHPDHSCRPVCEPHLCCNGVPQRPTPCECGCQHCRPHPYACPHAGLPPHGFLLPRIIASGRQWLQRFSLCLRVEDLPDCLQMPLTLLSVTCCGACSWEPMAGESNRICQLRVTIPLCCQVQDPCGEVFVGHASLTVEVPLRLSVSSTECWRNSIMVLPCVRMAGTPCGSNCAVFDVQLEVLVEAYMTRWEPCLTGTPRPVCPDLPLYPQPCFS